MANGSFVHVSVFCFFEMLRGRSIPASGKCVAAIDDDVEVGNGPSTTSAFRAGGSNVWPSHDYSEPVCSIRRIALKDL
ncbi:hypothetical protein, partial [Ruegeria atlantica]|uniref:hypothetical protein n=1 Tax=Ruegeria atlantica TaxID=81569 RepID=UPI001C2C8176